jgi:hypothetical protein
MENVSVDWKEAEASFHNVARLTLLPKWKVAPDLAGAIHF